MVSLTINGQSHEVDVPAEMPLLWVIRDIIGLTGTKFGCGVGLCGCCTVNVDAAAIRSCSFPVSAAAGKSITTIEVLGGEAMHPLQQAWIDHQVPQCGYCQSGQLMAAAALLAGTPHPSDAQISQSMTNICRCGTYNRIKATIATTASSAEGRS
jgi:isoquinoline 1-oxidoreductase alpha subunit